MFHHSQVLLVLHHILLRVASRTCRRDSIVSDAMDLLACDVAFPAALSAAPTARSWIPPRIACNNNALEAAHAGLASIIIMVVMNSNPYAASSFRKDNRTEFLFCIAAAFRYESPNSSTIH